ncbi:MAG: hypothetical protein HKN30_15535 [Sulfitobacter sp.]|nr:hypothetical protein [Sulfitobacter sp.]
MPPIVRFYILNCLIGFAVAGVFTGMVFYFNVANLWHLVSRSDIGLMASFVFFMLNGIVFAGVQTAIAVMLLADDDADDGPGGGTPVPARVPAQRGRSD